MAMVIDAALIAGLATCLQMSGALAQGMGLTFGVPMRGDDVRAVTPDHATRKGRAQTLICRSERHQVYDAQGQLVWRIIRVCG
jgi:hypothetical protein